MEKTDSQHSGMVGAQSVGSRPKLTKWSCFSCEPHHELSLHKELPLAPDQVNSANVSSLYKDLSLRNTRHNCNYIINSVLNI